MLDKRGAQRIQPVSPAFTKRCLPFSTLVMTIAARRTARSSFSAVRISSFILF